MAINPESAFTRVYFDMPTQLAIKVQEHCRQNGITRKNFILQQVEQAVNKPAKGKK